MMIDGGKRAICAICLLVGGVIPWALLVGAAVLSVLARSDYWSETAAYLAAFGLLLLSVSYLLARLSDLRNRIS